MVAKINSQLQEYKQEFDRICRESVLPILRDFEPVRKKYLRNMILICVAAVAVLYLIYNDFSSGRAPERSMISQFWNIITAIEFFIGIAAAFTVVFAPIITKNEFALSLKKECMKKILKVFGNIKWFDGKKCVSDFYLKDSDLFSEFTNRNTYDSFKGDYKDVNFEVSEIHLFCETKGRRKIIWSVFKGLVIKFGMNKKFDGKTIIVSKNDIMTKRNFSLLYILFGYILITSICSYVNILQFLLSLLLPTVIIFLIHIVYKYFSNRNSDIVLDEVKLEDAGFHKKYKAYSSNQVEARYLITPAFMERFKNLQTAFGTNKIKCSFNEDCLIFAISTWKNLFELGGLFINLENPKQLKKFFDELISIYMMIDYFKLDENTKL